MSASSKEHRSITSIQQISYMSCKIPVSSVLKGWLTVLFKASSVALSPSFLDLLLKGSPFLLHVAVAWLPCALLHVLLLNSP